VGLNNAKHVGSAHARRQRKKIEIVRKIAGQLKAVMHHGVLEPVMLYGFRDHRHAAAGVSLLHQTPA
jgi:hypothetical protein